MVFIILVNWKGAFDTIRCLESIFRSSYKNFKVIVVDNFSQDGSLDAISAWADGRLCVSNQGKSQVQHLSFPPINMKVPNISIKSNDLFSENILDWEPLIKDNKLFIISNSVNSGFGAGNNIGLNLIRKTKECRYYWLLNNDTVINSDTLNLLVKSSEVNPRTVIGSIIRYYENPGKIQVAGGGFFSSITGIVKTQFKFSKVNLNFINGASFFAPIDFLKEVGGFDENIFMYFEENDYCIRGGFHGFKFLCSEALVFHKMGGSMLGSERTWQHLFSNKYYTMKKHYGLGWWNMFFMASIIISAFIFKKNNGKSIAARNFLSDALKRILKF